MRILRISGPVGMEDVIIWNEGKGTSNTYVELPALEVLAGIFARYHHHKFRDLASDHPLIQLAHDFLNIRLDLVVRGYQHREAILLDSACSL